MDDEVEVVAVGQVAVGREVVSGLRPRTFTRTVWSRAGPVVTVPVATGSVSAASRNTVQRTSTSGPSPEPGLASATGVTRVQSSTPGRSATAGR